MMSAKWKNFFRWKIRWKDLFTRDRLLMRFLFIPLFVIGLATALHLQEVQIDILHPGVEASKYIIAPVDFDFQDQNVNSLLQQEAIQDIGPIYQIAEKEIKKTRSHIEKELLRNPAWREESRTTFNEIYTLLNNITQILHAIRWTDTYTLKKRAELHLDNSTFYPLPQFSDYTQPTILPDYFWKDIQNIVHQQHPNISETIINNIFSYYTTTHWNLQKDRESQARLQKIILDSFPPKIIHVQSGTKIIDQGEMITLRHTAMLQAMKNKLHEMQNLWSWQTILGSLFLSCIITTTGFLYLKTQHKNVLTCTRSLSLYMVIILMTLALSKCSEWMLLNYATKWHEWIRFPIIMPFAAALLCILLNPTLALFTSCALTLILREALTIKLPFFLFINGIPGIITVLSSMQVKQRKEIFIVGAKTWIIASILIIAFNISNNTLLSKTFLIDIMASGINMILLSTLLMGMIPMCEWIFHIITQITLMEVMDPSHPLLKRLMLEAPGTYQHSLVTGFLAEQAANAIHANGLLCRAASLFHDVGKIISPHYYSENQGKSDQFNIYQCLTNLEAACVIKSHVYEGINLLQQHRLPQTFIDIVTQHHGTSLVKFFYHKQMQETQEEVDQSPFRYSGPKPQTKEAVIIMLADSIEATFRSLDKKDNEENIRKKIHEIIQDKKDDRQLDEAPITLQELSEVEEVFANLLITFYHPRVKYPEAPPLKGIQ